MERDTANRPLGEESYDCRPLLGSGYQRSDSVVCMVACCCWVGVKVAASTWCCTEADWRPLDLAAGEDPFPPHTDFFFSFSSPDASACRLPKLAPGSRRMNKIMPRRLDLTSWAANCCGSGVPGPEMGWHSQPTKQSRWFLGKKR